MVEEPEKSDEPTEGAAEPTPNAARSDAEYWAKGVTTLRADQQPEGGVNLNVTGRRVVSPIQGFGQMWEKTYIVRLSGATASPEEVIAVWKEEFPSFWPSGNRFFDR